MSEHDRPVQVAATPAEGGVAAVRLCVLLACFDGAKRASAVRRPLGKQIREAGTILDEVVLRVSGKRKVQVHDPRRTVAGTLTPALTWGLFGLVAAGSLRSLAIWAVVGAICGGLFAYYTEHALSKTELKRIGQRLAPDSSAVALFVKAADAETILRSTASSQPATASVAAIAGDLSARVWSGASDPVELPSAPSTAQDGGGGAALLSMVLLRYKGAHTARGVKPHAGVQTELLFEVDGSGKPHVSSPGKGVAAMSKSDVISWGLFGVAFGAIAGFGGGGGILGFLQDGAVTGIAWAIFGLFAGTLYGLWAGRAVSARRLKGLAPLLPPDTSLMLAWADGAVTHQTIDALSTPDTERLILRFNPVANGVVLDAQGEP